MINSHFKLGKLPAKTDIRTLKLSNYISFPPPPISRTWSEKVSYYDILGNDKAGDCGPAGLLHQIQTWTANMGMEVKFTTEQAFKIYTDLTGYNPITGHNDKGVVLLDMIKTWKNQGFFGHKAGAFMEVNSRDLNLVRVAINEFGGVITRYALPISAQNKPRWDIDASFTGDGKYGSWGGHCTIETGYLENGDFDNVTWGTIIPSSGKFDMVYTDEKYVVLSRDFVNDKNMAPSGFDWDKMTYDLNNIS